MSFIPSPAWQRTKKVSSCFPSPSFWSLLSYFVSSQVVWMAFLWLTSMCFKDSWAANLKEEATVSNHSILPILQGAQCNLLSHYIYCMNSADSISKISFFRHNGFRIALLTCSPVLLHLRLLRCCSWCEEAAPICTGGWNCRLRYLLSPRTVEAHPFHLRSLLSHLNPKGTLWPHLRLNMICWFIFLILFHVAINWLKPNSWNFNLLKIFFLICELKRLFYSDVILKL